MFMNRCPDKKPHMTQSSIAIQLGVDRSFLSRIENNYCQPKNKERIKIVNFFRTFNSEIDDKDLFTYLTSK